MTADHPSVAQSDGGLVPYDAAAWNEVNTWRQRQLERRDRRLVPAAWRERLARTGTATKDRLEALPGAERFETLFLDALRGLTDLGSRAARASIRRDPIVKAYQKRGHAVMSLQDIRGLELRDIDKVKPRLDLAYIAASTVEGAGAGLAVSGGTILATGGSVFGAGAGAAPGAATVVGAMAADAAAVLVASHRAVAHVAAYYGYDVDEPGERMFALGVLSIGTASEAGKAAAYVELNKLVQALARRQTWKQLNSRVVSKIVGRVYAALGMRLTQRKLGQAVPVVGIMIGAGLNARLLSRITDDAEHLYRERFLREKYGLEPDVEPGSAADDDTVRLTEILDAEIVEE
jgi:hypothetical protein